MNLLQSRRATRDHRIASVDSLVRRAEELARTTGQSLDQTAAVVVEDLERSAATLTARTAPVMTGCGALTAASGILVNADLPSHAIAETFVGLAGALAAVGLTFLTRAVFHYAGRPVVGLSPVLDDISYVRARLVRKRTCGPVAGWRLRGLGSGQPVGRIHAGWHGGRPRRRTRVWAAARPAARLWSAAASADDAEGEPRGTAAAYQLGYLMPVDAIRGGGVG